MNIEIAIVAIRTEYERACKQFKSFNTEHEGYAIILEELDELWDDIKGGVDPDCIKAETVQVAAMALRFLTDCCE